MSRRHIVHLALLATALMVCSYAASAVAEPWNKLFSFKRVEADPNKSYRLTKQQGPWMIMAMSYSGTNSEEQAKALALELRSRYKLEAYTYRKHFDFVDQKDIRFNRHGEVVPIRYKPGRNDRDEIAVLVGNYASIDDPQAQATRKNLQYLHPKSQELDINNPTTRNLAQWRIFLKYASDEKRKMGPMAKTMVVPNPLLPKEAVMPAGLDPFVVEMNKHVKHSLLDCPGKYTVMVAQRRGNSVITRAEKEKLERGDMSMNSLEKAAMEAHQLTEALRLKGYEAYEFHDRYCSIVTIGSFDSMGTPRSDGRTEIDPRILRIIDIFKASPAQGPVPVGTLPSQLKSLVGVTFEVQPLAIHVPRRSIGREMAQR